jgi:two-component system response regulator (stage 0 sporulation protein A)
VLKPFSYEDLADKITFLSEPPEEPSEKEEMPESLYKVVVQQDYDGANHSEIKEFTDVLRKIGIPPKLKGYWYISEAIRICKQSKEDNIYITKILYPEIAKKFGASRFQVERAMRHSIERTWEKRDIDSLTDIFGDEALCDKRPTNQDFIMKIIAYLGKNKYANSDLVTNKNAWI